MSSCRIKHADVAIEPISINESDERNENQSKHCIVDVENDTSNKVVNDYVDGDDDVNVDDELLQVVRK